MLSSLSGHPEAKAFWEYLVTAEKEFEELKQPVFEVWIKWQIKELEEYIEDSTRMTEASLYIGNVQTTIDGSKKEYPEFNSEEFDNKLRELIIPACKQAVERHLANLKTHIDTPWENRDGYFVIQLEKNIEYWKKMLSSLSGHPEAQEFWEYLTTVETELEWLKQQIEEKVA